MRKLLIESDLNLGLRSFQSRCRDSVLRKCKKFNIPTDRAVCFLNVSVPLPGFSIEKVIELDGDERLDRCFSPVAGIQY